MFDVIRCWKPHLAASSAVLLAFGWTTASTLRAQESPSSTPHIEVLPSAPKPAQLNGSGSGIELEDAGSGSITGTVLDTNGDVVQGARVTLKRPADAAVRTTQSGANGQFVFNGLAPDTYEVTVTASGMRPFSSPQIALRAGEDYIAPSITLAVSGGTTSVTVNGSKEELSKQQEQIAVQQRIGGVIPNFYSTYDWNAPPMLAKQKYQLGLRSIFDPVAIVSVAGLAGAEQFKNVFPEYGSGIEGYSKRFGAAFATHTSGILLGRAVYPSIFHQDPRYFYKGKGSITSRALYAVSAAVIARGDDGGWKPNYSKVLGNFSAAALSNLYYPAPERGGYLILLNGLGGTGADAVANLIREFLLKRITSHVPEGATGEP